MIVHWCGGVDLPTGRILAGWPCCCSGRRATSIAAKPGAMSGQPSEVTCKTCLRVMERGGIFDTSTPLATPAPERRPAAGWQRAGRRVLLLRLHGVNCDVDPEPNATGYAWSTWATGEPPIDGHAPTLVAAQLAAEDAAARLLLAALAELPNARRLMAEALTEPSPPNPPRAG